MQFWKLENESKFRDRTDRELAELADDTEDTPEAKEKFDDDVDILCTEKFDSDGGSPSLMRAALAAVAAATFATPTR